MEIRPVTTSALRYVAFPTPAQLAHALGCTCGELAALDASDYEDLCWMLIDQHFAPRDAALQANLDAVRVR